MAKIFGIIGWSGSGKTDVVCRVIKYLKKKKVCVSSIKHTHHDFQIDKPGKDSFKQLNSGSNEVIIYSEKKWAMVSSLQIQEIKLSDIITKFSNQTEIIILEGMKFSKIPKIEVYRSSLNKPLLCRNDKYIKAIIYDKLNPEFSNYKIPKFSFNDTKGIGEFILNFTKNENE